MAVCDILIMLSYFIYTVRFGFLVDPQNAPMGYPYEWILFLFVHVVLRYGGSKILL